MYDTIEFKLCRLCLNSSGHLIDVFDENKLEFLVEKAIEELLQLSVSKEADCPWLLCSACLSKLIDFRLFKQRCVECQIVFDNHVQRGSLSKGRNHKNGPLRASSRGSEVYDGTMMLQYNGGSTVVEENVLMSTNYQSARDNDYKLCITDEMVNNAQELAMPSSSELVRERHFEIGPMPCSDELNQQPLIKEEDVNVDCNGLDRLTNEEETAGREEWQKNVSHVADNGSSTEIVVIDLDSDLPQASVEDAVKQGENKEDSIGSGQSQSDNTGSQRKRLFRKRKFFNIHKVWEENESYSGYYRKKMKPSIASPRWTTENSEIPVVTVPDSVEAQAEPSNSQASAAQEVKGFDEETIKTIVGLKQTLTGIETRLQSLEGGKFVGEAEEWTGPNVQLLNSFPLSNVNELLEVEKKLADVKYWKQLVLELSQIESTTSKGFIKSVMGRLMSLTLATKYSWIGFKKKSVFSTLRLKDLILDAIASSKWSEISETDAIEHIKAWLATAKNRLLVQRRRSKQLPNISE